MASVGPPGKPGGPHKAKRLSSSKAEQVPSSKHDLIDACVQKYQVFKIPFFGGILKALFGNMAAKQAIKDQILSQIGFQNKDALNGLSLVQLNQLAQATGALQQLGNRCTSEDKAAFVREWIRLTPEEVNALQGFVDGGPKDLPVDLASHQAIWGACKEISSLTNTDVILDECVDSVLEGTSKGRPLQGLVSRETSKKYSLSQEIQPNEVLYGRGDDKQMDASQLFVRVSITDPNTMETRTLRLSLGLKGTMTVREAREALRSSKQDWIETSKQEMGRCITACSRGEVDLKRNAEGRLEFKNGSPLTDSELKAAGEALKNSQPFTIKEAQVQFKHEHVKMGETDFVRLRTTLSKDGTEHTRETYYSPEQFTNLAGSLLLERDLQLARMEFSDASV